MSTATKSGWIRKGYQRIADAQYHAGQLTVRFEDGSNATLKAEHLLPSGASDIDWEAMTVDPFEISVPSAAGLVEIPWSTIRILTDSEYSAHLADVAEQQARQIGLRIRELREQRHLTSKELAIRAGISPQSLSRIEHGHHDVVFTTLQRILAAMGCRLQDLTVEPRTVVSPSAILQRLAPLGLDSDFVMRRLLWPSPTTSPGALDLHESADDTTRLLRGVSRVFGWSIPAILSNGPLTLNLAPAQAGRFKRYGRAEEIRASAYTVYAHYLALVLSQATEHLERKTISGDAEIVRQQVIAQYGSISFEYLVRYAWQMGIPVLPLYDTGAFHGACWRIRDRAVIVLKQSTESQSRWAFDLAHEWKHAADHVTEAHPTVVEDEEPSPIVSSASSDEEREASDFAGRLLLFGRAEELAQQCVEVSQGRLQRLKYAVQKVAEREHVPADTLANYLAFRLSKQGENWWGTANNLQVTEPHPWEIARDVMLEYADLDRLDSDDRQLLLAALSEQDTEV